MRNPRSSDDPPEMGLDSSREELLGGKDPKPGLLGVYDLIAIALAIAAAAFAASTLDSWALWVVLGGIIVVVLGFMIAVNPTRRG
jgi:hypothetical protein